VEVERRKTREVEGEDRKRQIGKGAKGGGAWRLIEGETSGSSMSGSPAKLTRKAGFFAVFRSSTSSRRANLGLIRGGFEKFDYKMGGLPSFSDRKSDVWIPAPGGFSVNPGAGSIADQGPHRLPPATVHGPPRAQVARPLLAVVHPAASWGAQKAQRRAGQGPKKLDGREEAGGLAPEAAGARILASSSVDGFR